MRISRMILAAVLLTVGPANAALGDDDDWQIFGRVLSLVQSVVHAAAKSDDPRAVEYGIDRLLSGEHGEANRLAADIAGDALADVPPEYKDTVLSLGKDLAALARKERERQPSVHLAGTEAALQARRNLAAIGLRYFDSAQLLEAVGRNDALAVELYVTGRGVDLAARNADGLTALELARRRNNHEVVDLLASAGR